MSKRTQVHKLSGRRTALSQFHRKPLWKALQNSVTPMCSPTAQLVHLCFLNWKPSIKTSGSTHPHTPWSIFDIFDIFPLEIPGSQIGLEDCLRPHIFSIASHSCRFLLCRSFSSSCFSDLTSFPIDSHCEQRPCILLLLFAYFPLLFVLPKVSCYGLVCHFL